MERWWRSGSTQSMWNLFGSGGRSIMTCSGQTREEDEGKLMPQSVGEMSAREMADVEALAVELMALSPEAASRRVSAVQSRYSHSYPCSLRAINVMKRKYRNFILTKSRSPASNM